ncbi:MAG: hypothetical protein L6R41_007584 [Letrouitia leprolyta]|nr:MAG: hypothetical protein L6R41_007584 [Letrouitia leprolyta]
MENLPPGMDPLKKPIALPPSPDIIPNLVNPQSRAPTAIGVIVLFTIFMFLFEITFIQAFYGPTILFTKLCLFILYYRLFSPSDVMRYLIYFGVAFNVVFYFIYIFLYAFLCKSKAQTCAMQLKTLGLVTTAINIVDDFYILSIPLAAISSLQLPPKKKVGLLAIFFTGFLACLCSIISLYYRVVLVREKDDVWNAVPVTVLGIVESNIGIICGCLPTLPALFRRSNFVSRKTGNKSSYEASSSTPANVRSGGGAARGFGRLGDVESKDSVVRLEEVRREEDMEVGEREYEMGRFQGEDERRKEEWFRQARM